MLNRDPRSYSRPGMVDERQLAVFNMLDWEWARRNGRFLLGNQPVSDTIEPIIVEISNLENIRLDYFPFISGLAKAVSGELANFLKPRIRAEFIPVKALFDGTVYDREQFFVMHLFDRFVAMDLEKCIYTEWPPEAGSGIRNVEKLILDTSKINGSPAFYLEELALEWFRNDICQSILDAGFKGLRFYPLEHYQNVRMLDWSIVS